MKKFYRIVRCTKNRKTATDEACHSRGYMRASGDGFVIYRTKEHNHPPGDLKRNPLERSFINTLCERARNELHLGLKDIYNEEVERFIFMIYFNVHVLNIKNAIITFFGLQKSFF